MPHVLYTNIQASNFKKLKPKNKGIVNNGDKKNSKTKNVQIFSLKTRLCWTSRRPSGARRQSIGMSTGEITLLTFCLQIYDLMVIILIVINLTHSILQMGPN